MVGSGKREDVSMNVWAGEIENVCHRVTYVVKNNDSKQKCFSFNLKRGADHADSWRALLQMLDDGGVLNDIVEIRMAAEGPSMDLVPTSVDGEDPDGQDAQ